jgi:hypothetical protein
MVMQILIYILIFYGGFAVGFIIKSWLQYRTGYNGALLVTKEEDNKKVYSLMLDDYPEKIEFKKEVILKVVASTEESDRT